MKNILAPAQAGVLRQIAADRTLLAFDFDGTLAPIVGDPHKARMRGTTRRKLARLCTLYPCTVISGRARSDLLEKLDGVPVRAAVGNHGMEPFGDVERSRWLTTLWHAQLTLSLPEIPGVMIEDKGMSLAIHYRHATNRASARKRILLVAGELQDVRIIQGKMVVNLLPAAAPDKGTAIRLLCQRTRCVRALYVGDDDNDEDAFNLSPSTVIGVRVGRSRRSKASFFLPTQFDVDQLLQLMVRLRESSRRRSG